MELIIVRHGQSKYNARLSDELGSELTKKGHSQAESLASFLASFDGYLGICSPYLRTVQTASKLATLAKLPFVVHAGPREYYVTSYSHRDLDSNGGVFVPKRDIPGIVYPPDQWHKEGRFFQRESTEVFVDRIKLFWYDLVGREQDKFIVVSHGAPCRVLAEFALGKSYQDCVRLCHEQEDALECLEHHPDSIRNCDAIYIKDGKVEWRRNGEGMAPMADLPTFKDYVKNRGPVDTSNRYCIVMRGFPGSGKSTRGKELLKEFGGGDPNDHIFSTDNQWIPETLEKRRRGETVSEEDEVKEYKRNWNADKLMAAHAENLRLFKYAIDNGVTPVVVDNTNVKVMDMRAYVEYADDNGYVVMIREPNSPWWKKYAHCLNDKKAKKKELEKFIEEMQEHGKHDVPTHIYWKMIDNYQLVVSVEMVLGHPPKTKKK